MIEFTQIIGRGTRLYDGKDYFTIYDSMQSLAGSRLFERALRCSARNPLGAVSRKPCSICPVLRH
jgi:type I site-specific restriction endonuclease